MGFPPAVRLFFPVQFSWHCAVFAPTFHPAHFGIEFPLERIFDVDNRLKMRPAQFCTQCLQNKFSVLGSIMLKNILLNPVAHLPPESITK